MIRTSSGRGRPAGCSERWSGRGRGKLQPSRRYGFAQAPETFDSVSRRWRLESWVETLTSSSCSIQPEQILVTQQDLSTGATLPDVVEGCVRTGRWISSHSVSRCSPQALLAKFAWHDFSGSASDGFSPTTSAPPIRMRSGAHLFGSRRYNERGFSGPRGGSENRSE